MPFVEIDLVEGRDPEQLRTLIHEVHGAMARALELPDKAVEVLLRIVPTTDWAIGDMTFAEIFAEAEQRPASAAAG